jgi:hypothetical protein
MEESMKKLSAATVIMALGSLYLATAANAYTVFNGTLTLKMTISIVSNISTATPVQCAFNITVFGASDSVEENDTVTATRSGSTAVCTLVVPYTWHLYTASGDQVNLSYSATAKDDNDNGRFTTNSLGPIGVPANGSNQSFSVGAKL